MVQDGGGLVPAATWGLLPDSETSPPDTVPFFLSEPKPTDAVTQEHRDATSTPPSPGLVVTSAEEHRGGRWRFLLFFVLFALLLHQLFVLLLSGERVCTL